MTEPRKPTDAERIEFKQAELRRAHEPFDSDAAPAPAALIDLNVILRALAEINADWQRAYDDLNAAWLKDYEALLRSTGDSGGPLDARCPNCGYRLRFAEQDSHRNHRCPANVERRAALTTAPVPAALPELP